MQKLRRKENTRIGYYSFEYRRIGRYSLLDESFVFSTTEEDKQLSASKFGEFAIFNADLLKNKFQADKYFIKAIKREPNNSFWLGNYAVFLHFYKKEINLAQRFYIQSLKVFKEDPFLLFNYSILLIFEKKNYDKAEKLLKLAIELDPDYPKYQCTYARFLFKIRNNKTKALQIIKNVLKKNPNNTHCLSCYVQFQIFEKDFFEAKRIIDKIFKLNPSDDIKLELWFYRYAHFHEWEEKAEYEMNRLIKNGIKTSAWGLQQNVLISIILGHSYPEKLEEYARIIEGVYRL